jgi:hypothetical protein
LRLWRLATAPVARLEAKRVVVDAAEAEEILSMSNMAWARAEHLQRASMS